MKLATGIVLTVFVALLLGAPQVQQALLLFFVAGVIPGSNFAVPPLLMLALLALGFVTLIKWTRRQQFYLQLQKHRKSAKKKSAQTPKTYVQTTRKLVGRVIRHWA